MLLCAVLLSACTRTAAGEPTAALAMVPARAPAPAPVPETRPVTSADAPTLVILEPDGTDTCWFEVKAIGLPAVRDDARLVAFIEPDATENTDDHPAGSDFVTVDLRDVEGSDRRRVAEEPSDRGVRPEGLDRTACRAYEQRLRARVHDYNVELRRFRPMEQLDVVVFDPHRVDEVDPSHILPARDVAPADRPVQALYHAGSFALRVPGIRVLAREAKPTWRVSSTLCDVDPHLQQVWAERSTGVGVVVVDHASETCPYDTDAIAIHPIAVPPGVFDELARRPSERYLELVDAAWDAVT